MVMLAFVVLGLFSYQRLKIDQFPNIDFPVVVITTEYPGASPEIVESEVSKKIEEGVNSIAGISALTSRSYEGMSVVVIEFQLHIDGRKGADDVREKVAALRPTLRTEVKEPKVLRFDPIQPRHLVAGRAARRQPRMASRSQRGRADQLGRPSAEKSAWKTCAAWARCRWWAEPNAKSICTSTRKPWKSWGISADQVVTAVKTETQDLPVGSLRSLTTRPRDSNSRAHAAPRGLWPNHRGAQKHHAHSLEPSGHRERRRARGRELGPVQRPTHLLMTVQKAQDENTIDVIDGLNKTVAEMKAQLPPGLRLEQVQDGSRPIRVGVANVRRNPH